MKWALTILVTVALCSCSNDDVGEYVFMELNKTHRSIIAHLDKNCGSSSKVLTPIAEVYNTAVYRNGQYTFKYMDMDNCPLCFCASCVSEYAMNRISDSICARHDMTAQEIQGLIDDLESLKQSLNK